jgi:hypothetical protein
MNNIFKNLPDQIVVENITPFLYKFQNKNILRDIRSFKKDFEMVENLYCCEPIRDKDYGIMLFFNDLKKFIKIIDNNSMLNSMLVSKHIYSPFFQRHIMLENKSIIGVAATQKCFYCNKLKKTSKIRTIWGLLTPSERKIFLNTFALENHE